MRGGSSNVKTNDDLSEKSLDSGMKSVSVLVSTSIGSDFLDKKKKLILSRNSTVYDLKQQIKLKFPGSPPEELQRLFLGVRELADHEILQNITTMPLIPILLDMITGTSVYSKSLSVSQAIDAYISSIVQQAYLGDQLRAFVDTSKNYNATGNTSTNESIPETSYYREMYHQLNESIYSKYAEDIRLALEAEKEPETISADTLAWRNSIRPREKRSLVKALAKEFDLNLRGLKGFMYYSALLVVRIIKAH